MSPRIVFTAAKMGDEFIASSISTLYYVLATHNNDNSSLTGHHITVCGKIALSFPMLSDRDMITEEHTQSTMCAESTIMMESNCALFIIATATVAPQAAQVPRHEAPDEDGLLVLASVHLLYQQEKQGHLLDKGQLQLVGGCQGPTGHQQHHFHRRVKAQCQASPKVNLLQSQ